MAPSERFCPPARRARVPHPYVAEALGPLVAPPPLAAGCSAARGAVRASRSVRCSGMQEHEMRDHLPLILAAAARGARRVTRGQQVVADAAVNTVQRWESVVLRGRAIADLESWASRVGANEAKRLLARSRPYTNRSVDGHAPDASVDIEAVAPGEDCVPDGGGAGLPRPAEGRELARWKKILRGRQFEVIARMLRPGMTLSRAAKELGMDRTNVRRSWRSALAGMKRCESDPPPPSI